MRAARSLRRSNSRRPSISSPAKHSRWSARRRARSTSSTVEVIALLDASRAITSTVELEETLDLVASEALKVVGATQSAIYEFDREADALVYRARCIGEGGEQHDALG